LASSLRLGACLEAKSVGKDLGDLRRKFEEFLTHGQMVICGISSRVTEVLAQEVAISMILNFPH
jgi:hypothetical protein